MPLVVGKGIVKSFGAQDVLRGIDFQIDEGDRIALVGSNGEGKSTILRIIAGLETPNAGEITRAHGLTVGYLPQQPPEPRGETVYNSMLPIFADLRARQAQLRRLEEAMADPTHRAQVLEQYGQLQQAFELAGGYTYELEIKQVLRGVGFSPEEFDKPLSVLSGGQRTRVALAELLLQKPSLLLLDEPTNHLDLAATEWLENHLLAWKGSLVIVAHDRYFLDRIAFKVWDLSFGKLETYRGNYSRYVEQKAEQLKKRQADYEAQKIWIARTEAFIRRYQAGQRAKEARGRLKKLSHLDRVERPQAKARLRLSFRSVQRSGDLVLRTRNLAVGFIDHPIGNGQPKVLFRVPDLVLHRLERVALIGPNGSGKTTFLRTIIGQIPSLSGEVRLGASVKVGYFSQTHEELDLKGSPLDEILRVKDLPIRQARNVLARFLFYGDDVFKPLESLSGGERSRVALAKLMLTEANFLILDEPTNHFDIDSREALEEVLLNFEGTILFVSHDRYLIDTLATQVWEVRGGRLHVYKGNYTEYLEQMRAEHEVRTPTAIENSLVQTVEPRKERLEERRRQAIARQRAKKAAELEKAIMGLEARLSQLDNALATASREGRVDAIRELGKEYGQVEAELERLMEEWVELGVPNDLS